MADLCGLAADKYADRRALTHKVGDEWVDVSYAELGRNVEEIALGLIDLGLEHGDKVSILGHTRPEWTYANFAILSCGTVSVSIYQTNSPEECQYVLAHSESQGRLRRGRRAAGQGPRGRGEPPPPRAHRDLRPRRATSATRSRWTTCASAARPATRPT